MDGGAGGHPRAAPVPKEAKGVLYRVAKSVLRPLFGWYFHWRLEGFHHLPRTGPAIVAANHVNYLDPLVIGSALPRTVHFMAKHELFENRILAWILPRVHAFPVRRGQPDRQAIRWALDILAAGEVLGIYPEGTRSETGELKDIHSGAALIALKSGAPVVPLAVIGLEKALDAGARRWPRRTPVTIRMGPPISFPPVDRVDRTTLRGASQEIHRAIAALLPAAYRGSWARAAAAGGEL
ncbi:MAG: 1-acyl-sn-glycerol-3-phosphate acyltransferase [Bacillota bacterium]|nr:1-acyl-sn-glycerol-3-phosphate acyltransferase [Bacillota bacterium]REJ36364.1 MAG: 1-acyl-sn-glycerol-3-phosphate acyltransferase [Bacillota bacterium]